jgi:hypothetical protein
VGFEADLVGRIGDLVLPFGRLDFGGRVFINKLNVFIIYLLIGWV